MIKILVWIEKEFIGYVLGEELLAVDGFLEIIIMCVVYVRLGSYGDSSVWFLFVYICVVLIVFYSIFLNGCEIGKW